MSTTSLAPEVAQFAAAVRRRLADLSDDEREELVGGLEADLSDLVEERGTEALGDPVLYARELRTAAGLDPDMGAVRSRRSLQEVVDERLDLGGERWRDAVTGLPGAPWEFLVTLRPAWWLLRSYVAVQTVDYLVDGGYDMAWVPTLGGLEWPLLVVAAVLSVQLGRGHLWPAAGWTSGPARLVLLGLNVFAAIMVVPVFGSLPNVSWQSISYTEEGPMSSGTGLTNAGMDVTNVFPYDAEGKPLTGVQLFDQHGEPLAVSPEVSDDYVDWTYPWSNVNGEVWNAFPMPVGEGEYDGGFRRHSPWTSDTPPTFPRPPLDRVPSVTVPDAAYGEEGVPQETTRETAPDTGKRSKSPR